mmetsp:Transcript_28090/g.65634  ORF Transcript_28090/g.65634 Transcript_28090/m.65634 type:complete len:241 (-) Transcript_28090:138-860(-)
MRLRPICARAIRTLLDCMCGSMTARMNTNSTLRCWVWSSTPMPSAQLLLWRPSLLWNRSWQLPVRSLQHLRPQQSSYRCCMRRGYVCVWQQASFWQHRRRLRARPAARASRGSRSKSGSSRHPTTSSSKRPKRWRWSSRLRVRSWRLRSSTSLASSSDCRSSRVRSPPTANKSSRRSRRRWSRCGCRGTSDYRSCDLALCSTWRAHQRRRSGSVSSASGSSWRPPGCATTSSSLTRRPQS